VRHAQRRRTLVARCCRRFGTLAASSAGTGATAGSGLPAGPTDTSISLSRIACFGSCPIYNVTIRGDGRVHYHGTDFVAVKGDREYSIDPHDVAKLVADFEAAHFFDLHDRYTSNVTDMPSYTLTLTIGARTKSVIDYDGTAVGMPKVVRDLEDEVDAVAHTAPLIGGK
jgi:Domain of unknown function (DUF6438)